MARRKRPTLSTLRAVGYSRVSTAEQVDSGAGLAAQEAAIRSEVARRGWDLLEIKVDAGVSGKTLDRQALVDALATLTAGGADVLVVAKLDRLSRSLLDFAGLMAKAQREGWNIVALDLGIDLSTPAGEFLASVMASAAQWERRIIGQRTRDALAARKAAGVRLGRPPVLPDATIQRIAKERTDGRTLAAIADCLTSDAVPTARGGNKWHASSVAAVLKSRQPR